MPSLEQKKPTFAPAYITGVYPILADKAKLYGYALAIHGSVQRDLDLIAIPWTDQAIEPVELIRKFCDLFNIEPNHDITKPEIKPHGRLAWSIPLWWGAYIDISIIPPMRN